MSVEAAFYIGKGTFADKLIRLRTFSDVSHVELVIDGIGYTSYPGVGVRAKPFVRNQNNWRMRTIRDADPEAVIRFFSQTRGLPYDWASVLIGQFLTVKIDERDKYFCSEWCARALGYCDAWRFSPAILEAALCPRDEASAATHIVY